MNPEKKRILKDLVQDYLVGATRLMMEVEPFEKLKEGKLRASLEKYFGKRTYANMLALANYATEKDLKKGGQNE